MNYLLIWPLMSKKHESSMSKPNIQRKTAKLPNLEPQIQYGSEKIEIGFQELGSQVCAFSWLWIPNGSGMILSQMSHTIYMSNLILKLTQNMGLNFISTIFNNETALKCNQNFETPILCFQEVSTFLLGWGSYCCWYWFGLSHL